MRWSASLPKSFLVYPPVTLCILSSGLCSIVPPHSLPRRRSGISVESACFRHHIHTCRHRHSSYPAWRDSFNYHFRQVGFHRTEGETEPSFDALLGFKTVDRVNKTDTRRPFCSWSPQAFGCNLYSSPVSCWSSLFGGGGCQLC